MKQGVVKFSKEFVTDTGLKEWAGIELPFNEERESGVDALRRAETIVNEYQRPKSYIMHYNITYQPQGNPGDELPEERQVGLTPELLTGCSDLTVLQEFYMLVKLSNRVDLKEAYDNRKAELVAKETKGILDATNSLSKKSFESLDDNK